MSNTHPKAIAAKAISDNNRAAKEYLKMEIKCAIQREKVHFLIVGKTTVCYRRNGKDTFEISTSIRHKNDRNDVLRGKSIALSRFRNIQRITAPIENNQHFPETLKNYIRAMFTWLP